MSQIRFFTDEDVFGAGAVAMRKAGFDAISTPDVGRVGRSDESQLQWTSDAGRVLVTFNVAHFAKLNAEWLQQSKRHAGIVVSIQRPIGDLLRRVLPLAGTLDAEEMPNRIAFLSDW